jgi:hypothetical protein
MLDAARVDAEWDRATALVRSDPARGAAGLLAVAQSLREACAADPARWGARVDLVIGPLRDRPLRDHLDAGQVGAVTAIVGERLAQERHAGGDLRPRLSTASRWLDETGRGDDAYPLLVEELALRRAAAPHDSAMLTALDRLRDLAERLGRRDEARVAATEAVAVARALAAADPARQGTALAAMLHREGEVLRASGEPELARDRIVEGLDVLRAQIDAGRMRAPEMLAAHLVAHASVSADLGDRATAAASATEAVEIYRRENPLLAGTLQRELDDAEALLARVMPRPLD